jgi:hypothetical protein
MINLKKDLTGYKCNFAFMLSLILLSCFTINQTNASPGKHKTSIAVEIPLKAFEGIYQLKENEFSYFKITAVNNKLVAKRMDGSQPFTLIRKSEFEFETKNNEGDKTLTVTFAKNVTGEIIQALVEGKQLWVKVKNYVPVKEVKLTPEQLKAFKGKYKYEEEENVFLQITATANGLLLKQLWDGKEINFIAISDLSFLNKEIGFPLKFTKDQNGNIVKVLALNKDLWDKVKE